MRRSATLVIVTATLLVAAAVVPGTATAEPVLSVAAEQDASGDVTVTVESNGTAVENATVVVDPLDDNATYDGSGEYETDANGTVHLPAPDETVTVYVVATDLAESTSTTVELQRPSLDVGVEQDAAGTTTVTVTSSITGEPTDDAAVNVSTADENATYDGVGNYTADANGTVELPAPEADVNVSVAADCDCATGSTTAELLAPSLDVGVEQSGDGSATVSVAYAITGEPVEGASVDVSTADGNESYAGTGEYETDENGTVVLPAPNGTVDVIVDASAGDLSGQAAVELRNASDVEEGEDADSFGRSVSDFVHSVLGERDDTTNVGRIVSAWVVANNPGNAPDHAGPKGEAGPPDHAGPSDDADEPAVEVTEDDDRAENSSIEGNDLGDRGSDAGPDRDDDRGPPAHAGGNGNARGNGR